MNPVIMRIGCICFGYIFGLFETAHFVGKLKGIDIRTKGSGNAGTTNTLRTLGLKYGLIVLFGDIMKCFIPCMIVRYALGSRFPEIGYLLVFYTALGTMLGHNFPFYMHFKGGKGMAVTAGMIFSGHWSFIPVGFVVFFGCFFGTHYVSLGSLMVYVFFMIQLVVEGQLGILVFQGVPTPQPVLIEMYIVGFCMAALTFYMHRTNIDRLLHHKERKTYLTKHSDQ